jgi:aspartate carbamoyltransferase catalytic subunit
MDKKQDLISISELSRDAIDEILASSEIMRSRTHLDLCQGKILASCFFEPSTRTRLSFETAMLRLGGSYIGFSDSSTTSAKKGETLSDTIRVIGSYADLLVIRHPEIGSAKIAAQSTNKPVINGGDGAGEHPSQTLVDLFTIFQTQKRIDGLTIGIVGDLKYGRGE